MHGPGDSNSSLDASCIMMINGWICRALVLASGCLFRHVRIILPQVLFYGEIFNSGFIFEDLNHGQGPCSTHTWWSWWGKAIPFTLRDLFLHQTSQAIGIMTRVNTPDETASLVSPAKFTFHTPPPRHCLWLLLTLPPWGELSYSVVQLSPCGHNFKSWPYRLLQTWWPERELIDGSSLTWFLCPCPGP